MYLPFKDGMEQWNDRKKKQLIFIGANQYQDPIILINGRPVYQLNVIDTFWMHLPILQSFHWIKNCSAVSQWPMVNFIIFIILK